MTNVPSRAVVAFALFAVCAGAQAQAPALPAAVAERAAAAGIDVRSLGIVVRRVGAASPLIAWQADRPFAPASTLKLLTAIAALDTLGPDFRARTELRLAGSQIGATWRGDVILKGLGNPDFDTTALERLLLRLRAQGVRRIDGDLVLDRTHYEPARTDVGLAPFDEAPEFRYNVVPDALALNMNLVHVAVSADRARMRIESAPALPGVRFRSAMTLVDAPCSTWDDLWQAPDIRTTGSSVVVTLQGRFPRECSIGTDINVVERDAYVARLFGVVWSRLGGTFHGRVREGKAPADSIVVAEQRSRALAEVVRDIEKRSDNPVTRMTWLNLGAASAAAEGTTAQRADRAVRSWLAAHRIDDAGLVLENGSGLSRRERIRPQTLAAVVEAAMASPWWVEFASGLPIAAVDGGLRNRLRDTPAAGTARLKTGTLRDVSALAGFVDVPGRGRYVLVAMVNDAAAPKEAARGVLDAVVEWVAREAPAP